MASEKQEPMTETEKTEPSERAAEKVPSNHRMKRAVSTPPYSSKIIKAGALLPDTKALLSAWDSELTVSENLRRAREHNLLGKTSRSRAVDVLAILRQRYLVEEDVARALARIVSSQPNGNTLDRILYFHAARADNLLRDTVVEILARYWARGTYEIGVREIERALNTWVQEGKTSAAWSDYTILRVARGLLSTLRDFGVLQGAVNKRIAPNYLSVQAFAYVALYLRLHEPLGTRLLDLDDWKLFFMSPEGVERFFLEAHQLGLLEYHVAGSVTRLTFPAETLAEYANVLTR